MLPFHSVIESVDAAIAHLHRVEVPAAPVSDKQRLAPVPASAPAFVRDVTAQMLLDNGDSLPVSALLTGEYGHDDIYIGVPASIGRRGIREVRELDLDSGEQEQFDASVAHLREAMTSVGL